MARQPVRQRKRIFVGCEGESERSYIALLQRLLGVNAAYHLITVVLNGGDPLATVDSAKKALRREAQRGRGEFLEKYILLDEDTVGHTQTRDRQVQRAAREEGFRLIWQRPCHEALLLRHLPRCQRRRPQSTSLALAALQREWPTYRKNCAAAELAERIDLEGVQRAAKVEEELFSLLSTLGLVD